MSKPNAHFNPKHHQETLIPLLHLLDRSLELPEPKLHQLTKSYKKPSGDFFSKSELIAGFKYYAHSQSFTSTLTQFVSRLKKKPIRSQSGVTTVSVLTKPFPCPGKCIFCPSDVRMPKSYLAGEPGAQRAARHAFDPYLQTYNRLKTLEENGHSVSKIELIVLGGTWSFYPPTYQIWFIKRLFEALNDYGSGVDHTQTVTTGIDFSAVTETIDGTRLTQTYNQAISRVLTQNHPRLLDSWESATFKELTAAHFTNQTSRCRNVGLSLETRPDHISKAEVTRLRRLGCTKVQIGLQSLSDRVLHLNHRGHTVAASRRALKLLRAAGFKIQAHWMPNLYGSSPQKDIRDFHKLFSDPDFKPDELKIYPCSLIASAELMGYYQQGLWQPYTQTELLQVLDHCLTHTPAHCRLSRVVRDIPSTDIVTGNKKTNFRQIVEQHFSNQSIKPRDIRAREIRDQKVTLKDLRLKILTYHTSIGTEKFLQFVTSDYKLAGFLRLSLPHKPSFIPEIKSSAIIREIHVYGIVAGVGEHSGKKAQHLGLGKKLIHRAKAIAKKSGFKDLAVISAVGTREYYQHLGFTQSKLYQHIKLI